jgi:cysteine synthase
MQYARTLDVIARPDVLVCGAGCAGTVAALAEALAEAVDRAAAGAAPRSGS